MNTAAATSHPNHSDSFCFARQGGRYIATPVQVDDDQVAALRASKVADLTWWTKTLRNAVNAATRTGGSYVIGRTATRPHILKADTFTAQDAGGMSLDYLVTMINGAVRMFRFEIAEEAA